MTGFAVVLLAATVPLQQSDTLTLERAIESARRIRPQLAYIGSVTAEARGRAGIAGAVPNPVLQYKHAETSPTSEANLEQRLDWIFARWPERGAARAGVRGAQADSARLEAELVRDVRIAFFQAVAASLAYELAFGNGASADSLTTIAARRVTSGDISVLEREQFAVEAGRLRQLLYRAVEAREIARAGLARATGNPAATGAVLSGALDAGLNTSWPARPGSEELPLLRRALADSATEHGLYRATTIRRFPIPSLILGRKWDEGSPFAGGTDAILGFTVPVPIWNIGSAPAAVARARAERAAALAGEARLEAQRLLDEGESRLLNTRVRALFTRDSLLPRAVRLRAGAVRLYRAGETGVLPVFDALRVEREIALGYIQDLLAWQVALSDWLVLLGRTQ